MTTEGGNAVSEDWERLRQEKQARTGWTSGGGWDLTDKEAADVLRASGIGEEAAWRQRNPTAIVGPSMKSIIETVDTWLDSAVSQTYQDQPLAQDWARVAKVTEEAGESISALIAFTGQNPRKGVYGTLDDLLGELADVVCTGLFAIQHYTKDPEATADVVEAALIKALNRATRATKG